MAQSPATNQSRSPSRKRAPAPVARKSQQAAPIAQAVSPSKQVAPSKKDKLVRDSFTLPREDFELIAVLKDRALDFKRATKKSELIRAGLQVLASLEPPALRSALEALRPIKAGRPKKKP